MGRGGANIYRADFGRAATFVAALRPPRGLGAVCPQSFSPLSPIFTPFIHRFYLLLGAMANAAEDDASWHALNGNLAG